MSLRRIAVSTVTLVVAVAPAMATGQAPAATADREWRVTKTIDDGSAGTLRWAIEGSSATPARDVIVVDLPPGEVVAVTSLLPRLVGPLLIQGAAWARAGRFAVIDGSGYVTGKGPESCPGATAGQFGANVRTMTSPGLQIIDTADVEIAGVEVRRFCIGVLINRSTRTVIRDSRFVENHGGAGVMLTGDDGQGNPTSTTTTDNKILRSEFLDNGDGLELTRGAAFNLVAGNTFRSTVANPEPSQGIEILRGNDNVVAENRFEGYSDGLQINWGDRNYIVANTFTGNTFGLNLTGLRNVVEDNTITGNRIGVVVRPADPSPIVRLKGNRISANTAAIRRCEAGGSCDDATPTGAIVMGLPGLEHESFTGSRGRGVTMNPATIQYICPSHAPGCQGPPNQGTTPPTLTAATVSGSTVVVTGRLTALANARYEVEFFGNTQATAADAEVALDNVVVVTDAQGNASFTVRIARDRVRGLRALTATATSAAGATSPLSPRLSLTALVSR